MSESDLGGQSCPGNRWFEHVIHAKEGGDLDPGDLYYNSGKAGSALDPGDLYFSQSNTESRGGIQRVIIAWQSKLLELLIRTPSIFE
jgi:hypothetical protein